MLDPEDISQSPEKHTEEDLQVPRQQNRPPTSPRRALLPYALLLLTLVASLAAIFIAGRTGIKKDEALCQKLSQSPSKANIILTCLDDGFRVYSPDGHVYFGNRLGSPWLSPSQLLVASTSYNSNLTESVRSEMYLVNLTDGTIEKAPVPNWDSEVFPHQDGKTIVRTTGNSDKSPLVEFVNMETGEIEVVYDTNISESQWAKEDAHRRDAEGRHWIGINVAWIADNAFLLTIEPFNSVSLPRSSFRPMITLVNIDEQSVRVLSQRGLVFSGSEGAPLVWQDGWIDGALYLLSPPYDGQPEQLSLNGPWKTDVAVAGSGEKVAWLESVPPPGDWSRVLPVTCKNCVGADRAPDPLPTLQSLAVWDSATGQTIRTEAPTGIIWDFSSTNLWESVNLYWRNDAETLLYATQSLDDNSKHTALYQMTMDGIATSLSNHDWYGNLHVEWVGSDNSIYYFITSPISVDTGFQEGPGKVWQIDPGGVISPLPESERTTDWVVDNHGLMETLSKRDTGAIVRDLNTGVVKHARFPQANPDEFGLSWNTIEDLIPLSPDGAWAAFAGSLSDVIDVETMRSDILVVKVK